MVGNPTPKQFVPGALTLEVKWSEHETGHGHHQVSRLGIYTRPSSQTSSRQFNTGKTFSQPYVCISPFFAIRGTSTYDDPQNHP